MSDAQAAETTAAPTPAPADGPREINLSPLPAVDASQQGTATQETKQEGTPEAKTTETTEQVSDAGEAEGTQRDEQGRFQKKEGVQPRIDELTRARREAERERDYWKQVAAGQTSAQAAPTPPTPDQFDDYGDYVKALTKYETKQALAEQNVENSNRKVAETRVQTFEQNLADARTRIKDFDAVVGSSDTPISAHVGELLQDSAKAGDLAYHFAKNPDVLRSLNGMTERQAAMEIGRLEARIAPAPAPGPAPAPAPSVKVSQTPAPANTSSNAGRSTTPDIASMSMEDYKAHRAKQGARWAR